MTAVIVGLLISLGALIYAASAELPLVHMAIAAVTSLLIAITSIIENRRLHAAGTSKNMLSAATSRHMATVWFWGAAGLLITYAFILFWPEWWKFFAAFAGLGVLTAFLGYQSARDEAAGKTDKAMQKLGRGLSIGLAIAMVGTMAGLLIDGKMTRFMDPTEKWQDWAGNNIFFFGALALFLISVNALWTSRNIKL